MTYNLTPESATTRLLGQNMAIAEQEDTHMSNHYYTDIELIWQLMRGV